MGLELCMQSMGVGVALGKHRVVVWHVSCAVWQ